MNSSVGICQDDRRRREVRQSHYNGLDYLEVEPDQRTLNVYFLGRAPEWLDRNEAGENRRYVRIRGGRRIRDIQVQRAQVMLAEDADQDDWLEVRVDKPGDFSTYTLVLTNLPQEARIDPRYACIDFSFKTDCPSDLDCLPGDDCPPPDYDEPELSYLAKDYASFRQLILDRLALIMPDWKERHVPDVGIALVELLAYMGDYLSYHQDAAATEAYLATARQRTSVRRHARLVDYHMHEGCNARAFLCVHVDDDLALDPEDTMFVTDLRRLEPRVEHTLSAVDLDKLPAEQYEVFEPLSGDIEQLWLYKAHNRIRFYTWGDGECCLPRGTTKAWLIGGPQAVPQGEEEHEQKPDVQQAPVAEQFPQDAQDAYQWDLHLEAGDYLIFEEVMDPRTGQEADANPQHRLVVRLTGVERLVDELYRQPLLEITWAEEDALPFPLCLSATSAAPQCLPLTDISVACGNVIVVDHGRRVHDENLGCVPLETTESECECGDRLSDVRYIAGRFRPRLKRRSLTFRQPPTPDAPAARVMLQDPRQALPWIRLTSFADDACRSDYTDEEPAEWDGQAGNDDGAQSRTSWTAQRDLLDSRPQEFHYVVEMDDRRVAHLRFGDGELGQQPAARDRFRATYRRGNGPEGNVGAETIRHLVYRLQKQEGISYVRNPLPAAGGTAPEPDREVKLFAPYAFQGELKRAITAADYANIVMRDFANEVQRAAASLRWMGSWYEVLVAVDARDQVEADAELLQQIKAHLYRYRRVGHDLAVVSARTVPLFLEIEVCVSASHLRGHVKAALLDLFSNRRLPGGEAGFFHPDNLTFGEGVYLSKIVAAAQVVRGVEFVTVRRLERYLQGASGEIEAGVLPLGVLEVARLDNDRSFPENGVLNLIMRGGR